MKHSAVSLCVMVLSFLILTKGHEPDYQTYKFHGLILLKLSLRKCINLQTRHVLEILSFFILTRGHVRDNQTRKCHGHILLKLFLRP